MCIGKIDKPNIENNYKILEYTHSETFISYVQIYFNTRIISSNSIHMLKCVFVGNNI